MKSFVIPACNMGQLSLKIERLNRRADKLGLPQVQTHVMGFLPAEYDLDGLRTKGDRYEVGISGDAPKLPGWEFVGTLEHTPAGNIIRILPGQTVPEAYRTVAPRCEHCQTKRLRKDTYLVRSDAGELKQVARNCIKDFLGHTSPERMAWLATLLLEMERLGNEEFSGRGRPTASVVTVLELSTAAIRQFGWVSRQAAQNYAAKVDSSEAGGKYLTPTISRVWAELDPSPEARERREKHPEDAIKVIEADRTLAAEALVWARALPPSQSDYLHNLRIIAHKDYVELGNRDGGLLASLVPAYQKEVLKQIQERKRRETLADIAAKSNYQGEVGKRADWTLTLKRKIVIASNDYSRNEHDCLYLYCFEDSSGNQFTWMTGKTGMDGIETLRYADGMEYHRAKVMPFVEGCTYTVRGTVKEHREYKGIKQTVLTRCQVTELAKEAA